MSALKVGRLRGIVPYYKEAGVNSHTVFKWIKLHVDGEFGSIGRSTPIKLHRKLEPYASGVITVGIGPISRYVKYLAFCDAEYTVKVKLGYTTVTDYFEDKVIEEKAFDHINLDLLKEATQSFIGNYVQKLPDVFFPSSWKSYDPDENKFQERRLINGLTGCDVDEGEIGEEASSDDAVITWDWNQDRRYAFRVTPQHRQVDCHGIEIFNFDPPEFCMNVRCSTNFSIRRLLRDLTSKLNTSGTIIELRKTREGPFLINDCIDRTDLYMKYFIPALWRHTLPFIDHVREHLDKLPLNEEKRLIGI